MTIPEMHVYFRQYAQQMGMQNVRAILPEQIDILINTSISDEVNEIIQTNVGLTSDRIVTDNSKIGQINALRSIYKVEEVDFATIFDPSEVQTYTPHWESDYSAMKANTTFVTNANTNYWFLADFSLNYKNGNFITNYFPIRVVDDIYLSDAINDFVLSPRFRSPVMVIHSNNNGKEYGDTVKFVAYLGKGTYSNGNITLANGLVPNKFRVSYIGKPAIVAYNEDIGGTNVDCDLPENLHIKIVKRAVDLANTIMQGSLMNAQAQQQRQAREQVRNNARSDAQNANQGN